jgi:hydroxyacylglutathione hydrolase
MIKVSVLPILTDNYVFVIHSQDKAIVVDPGEAKPVLDFLQIEHLDLEAILITHHHPDHIGGIRALTDIYKVPVYCSEYDKDRVPLHTHLLMEGNKLRFLNINFEVLDIKGHTLGHIGYYCAEIQSLFSGDTIFGLGCGRLFEGSAEQMWESFATIKALPKQTKIYFTHEYTKANLEFAKSVDTKTDWSSIASQLKIPSTPSSLEFELKHNVFLRAANAEEFKQLRIRKDHFRA